MGRKAARKQAASAVLTKIVFLDGAISQGSACCIHMYPPQAGLGIGWQDGDMSLRAAQHASFFTKPGCQLPDQGCRKTFRAVH